MQGKQQSPLFPARVLLVLLIALTLTCPAPAREWTKEKKAAALNLAGAAGITAWGVASWDYFENTPKKAHEGWFSENTPEGGADKWAHFYFSYTLSHALASTYLCWGFDREKAGALGTLSSFGLMGYMELGDSFSAYGFSHEDFIMNTLGCTAGWLLYRHKKLAEKIDFRMEYIPRFQDEDLATDYEHMKFLAAVKLSGFRQTQQTPWRYLEFHLGYFARGYAKDSDRERNIYLGIGINLSEIFQALSMKKTATVFNYYQLPHTYIGPTRNLNQ
jgi:hypothetical protein